MSIYSRSYMRGERPGHSFGEWALKGVLVVLVVVFIVQNIFRHWLGSGFIEANFALSVPRLSEGWVHTLLTYGFLHSVEGGLPWHLVLNGLMLYWFGKEIETRLGSQRFLELFVFCILTGGIIWVCVHFVTGQAVTVLGCSAAVFGVMYLFCRYRWDSAMTFLFIPVQFTGKQLFWVLLGFQLFFFLFGELPGSIGSASANSAHLGGMLGAFIYEQHLLGRATLGSLLGRLRPRTQVRAPRWRRKAEAVKARTGGRFTVNTGADEAPPDRGELRREVDRILDKINAKGFGALSDEEKKTLDRARDLL